MATSRLAVVMFVGSMLIGAVGCKASKETKSEGTFSIGGVVSGLEGSGLMLATAGEPDLAIAPGATDFTFANKVASGTVYAVIVVQQPTNPSQRCVVAYGTGSVQRVDVTDVLLTCSALQPRILGGRVIGLEGNGLVLATPGQVDLSVEPGRTAFTFKDGVPIGTEYTITVASQPTGPEQTCVVAHGEGVVGGAELFDAIVTCFVPTGRKALTVAAGDGSSFVITEDGALWAWGDNSAGQLGDGSREDRSTPILIGSGFASVVTTPYAAYHGARTLAIKGDASLWAWGDWGGLLGHASGVQLLSPELVGPGYTSAALGEDHALAVKADGSLWAWGSNNYYGQLGTGTLYDWKAEPVPVLVGSGFSAVAAAGATSYAVKTDGTLWAWGENFGGQIGDGTRELRPLPVFVASDTAAVMAAIWGHAFAVKSDGSLWAWGDWGGSSTERISPVKIGEGFVSVAFPLGLVSDGTLWEWSSDAFGQPALVGEGFRAVAAGGGHSIAARLDGTVWAWGPDASAQPSLSSHQSPVQIGAGYAAVSAGTGSVIALKTDGSAWQWGWDCQGGVYPPAQFGDGFASAVAGAYALRGDGTIWLHYIWSPVLEQLPVGDGFYTLAVSDHILAVKTDNTLWGWGRNDYWQIAKGLASRLDTPVLIESQVASAAVGSFHSVAVDTNGTLLEWGVNGSDFMGNGENGLPGVAHVGDGFVSVAANSDHSLAIKADGTLWAWGGNATGSLGDGTRAAQPRPVPIASRSAEGIASVEAASDHTLAIDRGGSLWAWGWNGTGQLGDGTTVDRLSPVEIGSGFARVSSADVFFWFDMCLGDSFGYTLAVKPDGTLWGWGSNKYGSLGLPTFATRPQQVPF